MRRDSNKLILMLRKNVDNFLHTWYDKTSSHIKKIPIQILLNTSYLQCTLTTIYALKLIISQVRHGSIYCMASLKS